jgi:hypothetical protein
VSSSVVGGPSYKESSSGFGASGSDGSSIGGFSGVSVEFP